MENLYQADYQDIEFKLDDGKTFGAHRLILVNSEVEWFKTMLTSQFIDSTQKTVEVRDIESDVFEIALKYAYHIRPKVVNYDYETIYPIFKAASYFTCFSLIHPLVNGPQDVESKLCCIDCALQFGGEILKLFHGLKLNIASIRTYFFDKYLVTDVDEEEQSTDEDQTENEKMVLDMINETLDMSVLVQSDIWDFLYESLETCDEECLIVLLKKIDYEFNLSPRYIHVLTRLAKKGLVPYLEIIHLLSYGQHKFILETFPLKVGYVSSQRSEVGTLMFGWDPKRKQKINFENMYIPTSIIQYVYYDDGEPMSHHESDNKEVTAENNEILVTPIEGDLFRDINTGFILKQNPNGTIIAIHIDENGKVRDLTPEEKEQARAMGLGVVEAAAPKGIPMMPRLPEQCKYVFTRGPYKSQRCQVTADDDSQYCKQCRKKSSVKSLDRSARI